MKKASAIIFMAVVLFAAVAVAADVVYVKSMKAEVRESPSFKAKTVMIAGKGTMLNVVEKKGRWIKVGHAGKTGWVTALLVDANPPMKRVSVFSGENQTDLSQGARKRASQVTSAAAARGLAEDDRRRLGHQGVADYGSLERIETVSISDAELAGFQEGIR